MQPIETARRKEAGDRVGAAFDQNAAEAACGQRGNDGGGANLTVAHGKPHDFDAGGKRCGRFDGANDEPAAPVGRQKPRGRRQSAARIDHDPRRVWALDAPDGQLRIVGDRRAYADDDRVNQRPQPMQMDEAGLAIDIVGVSARGGDAGVDGLATLPNHDEVIDLATTQWAENVLPRARQGTVGAAKRYRNWRPR
jgi:hypothetical protein